jgi:hypothetical protein
MGLNHEVKLARTQYDEGSRVDGAPSQRRLVLHNGWRSAAVERINSRRGHERSECLGAFHRSAVCGNAC